MLNQKWRCAVFMLRKLINAYRYHEDSGYEIFIIKLFINAQC